MSATAQSQLTDVTRTVTTTEQGHVVSLSQTFAVHPEELWSALTVGSHLEVWFSRASGEAVEGGRFELVDMETRGTVLAAEEPRRLLLGWGIGKAATQLELLVEPVGQEPLATTFTLRHTVRDDAQWQALGPAGTGCAWDAALYGLALHLEDPAADQLPHLSRFAASPEGADFTRATAEAWYEAHVAAGADRKPARKASVRTAALYLDEEPELS